MCCKDLFTGLVLVTAEPNTHWPTLVNSHMYQSEVQGEFAAVKPVLAEHIAHATLCQMARPPASTNVPCSWCHRGIEGPWGGPGWAEKRAMCFQGGHGGAKLPLGQH